MRIDVNQVAVDGLDTGPEVDKMLDKLGEEVAFDAARDAPKLTGRGARSIHQELGRDYHSSYVRISWTKETFYMRFAELGTSHQNPTPFLRPALAKKRTL